MIIPFQDQMPTIEADVFIAPTAVVIGNVHIKSGASIWFGAVLRGDLNLIEIGANTSIQDNCVVHTNGRAQTIVGDNCVVGHAVVMEGCTIGAGSMLGMNCTILSGATIGTESIVAAGAVAKENTTYPARALLAGVPASVRRILSDEEAARVMKGVDHYLEIQHQYASINIAPKP